MSITWELGRNTNSQPHSRPTESEILWVGLSKPSTLKSLVCRYVMWRYVSDVILMPTSLHKNLPHFTSPSSTSQGTIACFEKVTCLLTQFHKTLSLPSPQRTGNRKCQPSMPFAQTDMAVVTRPESSSTQSKGGANQTVSSCTTACTSFVQ